MGHINKNGTSQITWNMLVMNRARKFAMSGIVTSISTQKERLTAFMNQNINNQVISFTLLK